MKTKKLFLIYNNPDDSIILWDKQGKEILCSWATDTPISDVLKDIGIEHKEEEKIYRIYLVLSFDILKDLNSQKEKQMTQKQKNKLNKLFSADLTATQIAFLSGISYPTINKILKEVRKHIAFFCEKESPFKKGEIEIDESYFGAKRIRGRRGRGSYGKTIVFGLKQRKGRI